MLMMLQDISWSAPVRQDPKVPFTLPKSLRFDPSVKGGIFSYHSQRNKVDSTQCTNRLESLSPRTSTDRFSESTSSDLSKHFPGGVKYARRYANGGSRSPFTLLITANFATFQSLRKMHSFRQSLKVQSSTSDQWRNTNKLSTLVDNCVLCCIRFQ